MFKNEHLFIWIVTGIFLWPLLAFVADGLFGEIGSDIVAYLGIAIVVWLYILLIVKYIKIGRERELKFTYHTYRVAIRRGYDTMWKTHSLYKDHYTYRGLWRDAVSKVIKLQMRRKREHQRWPGDRYIANIVAARLMARSTLKASIEGKGAAIRKILNFRTASTPNQ